MHFRQVCGHGSKVRSWPNVPSPLGGSQTLNAAVDPTRLFAVAEAGFRLHSPDRYRVGPKIDQTFLMRTTNPLKRLRGASLSPSQHERGLFACYVRLSQGQHATMRAMRDQPVQVVDAFNERAEPSLSSTVATMRRVLSDRYGIDSPDLSESSEISALGLDSLSFFEYTFELEEALQLKFVDLPRDFATIGDLIRFVHGEVVRQGMRSDSR